MTELSEEQKRNLENDWGPAAAHSDYKPGDLLRYRADGSTWQGTIVWVAAPSPSLIEGHTNILPLCYIVEREGWEDSIPDVVYSSDILQSTDEYPTLVKCKFCPGYHYRGQEQYCDRNPNNPG